LLVVGIDENGLGPLLGPLAVTAAAFEAHGYDRSRFWAAPGDGVVAADSKEIFSPSHLDRAEAATLAWLEAFGIAALTDAALEERLSLPFERPCPAPVPGPCRAGPAPLPAWSRTTTQAGIAGRMASAGVRPADARAFVLCPGAFNRALEDRSMNKLELDFSLMLRLAAHFASAWPGEILFLCGKVGGTRRYGPWLDRAPLGPWLAQGEAPELSTYRSGRLTLSFVRDGDGMHLPVAVASMIGKYLRELAMTRLNRDLGSQGVRRASGYRDRVTAAFVDSSSQRRRELALPDSCFLRRS
jgi:ribonuclease HII